MYTSTQTFVLAEDRTFAASSVLTSIKLPPKINLRERVYRCAELRRNPSLLFKREMEFENFLLQYFNREDAPFYSPLYIEKAIVDLFNPSNIPSLAHPYYVLETAIKIGDLDGVKLIFDRYEKEMSNTFKAEMRSGIYSEVPYRPIFWLAAVADSNKSFLKPHPQDYINIMEFLEDKLDIGLDHLHLTPTRTFTRMEYINTFCSNPEKKEAVKLHYDFKKVLRAQAQPRRV